jgi:hypothetical protein
MEDIKNIELFDDLTLEPRLQEYLKKLSYYKKNNIEPSVNIKKEYEITRDDQTRIMAFLKGHQDIYSFNSQDKYNKQEQELNNSFKIKYEDYKQDPRYERLQKKLQRDRDANLGKNNYNKSNIPGINNNNFITDAEYLKKENSNFFLDSQKYSSDYYLNVRNNSRRTYANDNVVPKIEYNQYLSHSQSDDARIKNMHDNNDISKLITELDSYRKHTNTIYQHSSDMDHDTKINVPVVNSRDKKYINTTSYQAVPLKSGSINAIGGTRDIDTENNLIRGLPERDAKFKSLGYPNYSDHSFGFISSDLQDPAHTVLPFPRGGNLTRLENDYRRAKPYEREYY